MTLNPHNEMWSYLFRRKSDPERALNSTLRKVPLFSQLGGKEMRLVRNIVHRRNYQPGEVVFQEGEAGWGMYIIEKGVVRITGMNRHNQEVEYALLHDNEFFGEFALIHTEPRSATAMAVESSSLLGFFESDLQDLIGKNPRLGCKILLRLAQVLGQRLEAMNDKLKTMQESLPAISQRRVPDL